MPNDASDLLGTLFEAIEQTARLERDLRTTAEALAGWRQVAQAACAVLDREYADRRTQMPPEQSHSGKGDPC
jgi:hypothetical protein